MRGSQKGRRQLVKEFGAACQRCGYNRCMRALHFHHCDGSEKKEWSKGLGHASTEEIRAHPERFTLLCANCHIEEHDAIDKANRMMVPCQACGKEFRTFRHRLAEGKGKYCSKQCQRSTDEVPTRDNAAQRFWRFVEKTDRCWNWTSVTATNGAPMLQVRQDDGIGKCFISARWLSYKMHRAEIPRRTRVKSICGNQRCVNPSHLALVNRRRKRPTAKPTLPFMNSDQDSNG